MLKQQGTYIYSIEGKDLYGRMLEIKKGKKRKATLDYSLEAIQLEEVAKKVFKKSKKRYENLFFQEEDKQYTNAIINVTFKYNVKKYNLITTKDKTYYVLLNSDLDSKSIKNVNFKNGIYKVIDEVEQEGIKKEKIVAIEIDAETTLKSKELPNGFNVNKEGKIYLSSTGIETVANSDEIRKELYTNGFKVKYEKEEVEYIRFKRSSGSSRVGKCLFIDKRLYVDMVEWSMMGLKFNKDEKIDLAGLEAYIALTTSSIIDTINIEPKNILLIDDHESNFTDTVMVTEIKKEKYIDENNEEKERDRLHTEPKEINITNSIWDGQSLLDSSLFEEKYKDKGMLLLRNRFFKSCCFNCNIQKFFKDNNITEISQLKGKTLASNIEDIKLITTPSSIKYLKYGSWEQYMSLLDSTFGIVKYDKPTHYFNGRMVQTHYQLLNTLQLSENDMREFLKDSLNYIRLLKTDIRVFREHLNIKIKDEIEYGDINSTDEFIMTMLKLNNKFENTDLFNTFRQDTIKSYIRNMKKGHILIHGNYSVLCGSGLEMLKASCGLFDGDSLLDIDEVYCKNFKLEKELIGSRSPHVTMGNVWILKNTTKQKAKEINKYFNSSRQIVHITSIKNNVLERLSSADFDSDSLLLSDLELLIEKAKQNYNRFLVPTSNVHAKKVPRLNTPEEKCDLDIKTSKNLIGQIINCSQILNSQLWDILNSNKEYDEKYINELYAIISQLDVMSCIEIDKAKKEFSIDNELELEDIRKKYIHNKKKPLFFKFLAKEKGNEIKAKNYIKHSTSMDYLIDIINKETRKITQKYRRGENSTVTFGELFSEEVKLQLSNANGKQAESIINKCEELKKEIGNIWANENTESSEKYKQVVELKKKHLRNLKKLKVSSETIKKIIYNLDQESKKIKKGISVKTELNKNARNILYTLYQIHKDKFIELFEESKEKIEIITRVNKINENQEVINIYNMKYIVKND